MFKQHDFRKSDDRNNNSGAAMSVAVDVPVSNGQPKPGSLGGRAFINRWPCAAANRSE
jgi:hypothetical protein